MTLRVGSIVHVHASDGECHAAIVTEAHPGETARLTLFAPNGPRASRDLYGPGSHDEPATGVWHWPDHD